MLNVISKVIRSTIKNALVYLLILSIAFQPIITIADAHQDHQAGVKHLEFEHDHDENTAADNQTNENTFDCCHCHGGHVSSLLPLILSLTFLFPNQAILISEKSFKSNLTYRLLRPPQA